MKKQELSNKEIQNLIKENIELKEELALIEATGIKKKENFKKSGFFLGDILLKVFVGGKLYQNTINFWDAVSNAIKGKNIDNLEEPAKTFTAALLSRIFRTSIFLLILSSLPSLFLIIQTVLISQQNKIIDQQKAQMDTQNSLLALEQISTFRTLLRQPPLDSLDKPIKDYPFITKGIGNWPPPNLSVVAQIEILAEQNPNLVVQSLFPLLQDEDISISSGTLVVLNRLINSPDEKVRKATADLFRVNRAVSSFILTVNMEKADLSGEILDSFFFYNGNFEKAYLFGTSFFGGILDESNFYGAELIEANLDSASIKNCNFQFANLEGTTFEGTDIEGSDFRNSLNLELDVLKKSLNWEKAYYSREVLEKLNLDKNHNEILKTTLYQERIF